MLFVKRFYNYSNYVGLPYERQNDWMLLHQLKKIEAERHGLDDVLVGLVVPLAGDELYGPGTGEGPAAQRGAVAVLLDDVQVALVVRVGEAEAARGDGLVLEPVEEVPVLGGAALEGDVREGEAAWALVGDEGAAFEVLDVRYLH